MGWLHQDPAFTDALEECVPHPKEDAEACFQWMEAFNQGDVAEFINKCICHFTKLGCGKQEWRDNNTPSIDTTETEE